MSNETKPQANNRTRYGVRQLAYDKLDTTPIAMPAGAVQPPSIEELVAKYLRIERAREALSDEEPETWEEANDFEEEDPDTLDFSPYELTELQEELAASYVEKPPEEASEAIKQDLTPKQEQSEGGGVRALTDAENRSSDQGEPSEASR